MLAQSASFSHGESKPPGAPPSVPMPPVPPPDEDELDAQAAVAQAKLVKQPPNTAIYFGIDFELGADRNEQAVQYFTIVSDELKDNGYLVGVYGSGAALALLRGERHKTGRHAGQPLVPDR